MLPYLADFTVQFNTGAVVALVAGISILVVPKLLNYIIAAYLIVVGILGLFPG